MSLGYFFKKSLGSFLFLSVFILQSVLAQGSGTIKGRVYDKTTKDALPGANVTIKGTSVGAAANLDGAYNIHNAPAGRQTVVVSYLGYVSTSIGLDIPEGGTVTQDFSLVATAIQGEEILVTAQAKGQMQAINQQLASNKISSVVSEAKIQELPDFNAAQAISRLPGVSTLESSGEANKVVIRGLAPQYNAIAVAGITLASTGSDKSGIGAAGISSNPDILFSATNQDRSVDLTMVTPYMIKSISVYKSLTPDLDANAVGGRVEMDLREAPSGYHADVLWQSGYVGKSKNYGNYRFVASGSNRFFGDALGLYVLGNVEQYDRGSDNMSASYAPVNQVVDSTGWAPVKVSNVQLTRHLETRQRYGGNIILDYMLPFGVLRSTNLFSRLNSDYQEYQQRLLYQDHNVQYRYQEGNKKTDVALNTLEADLDFNFLSVNLKAASNYSRNYEPHSAFVIFNETGAIQGTVDANTRPEDLAHLVKFGGPSDVYLWSINLFNLDFKENDQVYKSDFKIPFSVGSDVSGSFKFGGEYRYNQRVNNQTLPYARIDRGSSIQNAMSDSLVRHFGISYTPSNGRFNGTNFTYPTDPDLREPFLDDRFGGLVWIPTTEKLGPMVDYLANEPSFNSIYSTGTNAGGWFSGAYERLANYYKYIEKYHAGYLMTDLSLGPDITLVGGARFEQDNSLFEAFNMKDGRNPGTQIPYPVTVYPQNHYWLPMVQGKYNVTDWVDVRYSYTQTLARPDYTQMTPHFTMDFSRQNVWAGNPKLVPGRAYNHDVQLTFHNNDLGLLSIGAFYKTIKNFTYYTQYKLHAHPTPGLDSVGTYNVGGVSPTDGALLNTYFNSPYEATVKGIEADFQTRFWYLPVPFNGVVLGINYTHIWSKATYPWRNDVTFTNPNPPPRFLVVTIDSTREGRLINQPNDIMNAYLGYDYEGFSGRVSFVFQGNSVSSIGIFETQDGFTRDYFRVDASARQKMPWAGFQLFLDVTNLNARRNEAAQPSIGGFTSVQNYGIAANFGIRFAL